MSKAENRVKAARAAADHLESLGEHKRAEDVRALCRSFSILRMTTSSIHRELEETRRAAGLPTWERKSTNADAN